ncbi:unnamed protein product [Effrenium voratum]|uniref:Helicase C-terminal domain-containing protein n=1 Tax=Effrenium voratum TaxID=2562239 RepID=A0AA36IC63_9DINO|nr:unnamed protein product [Effrenium voratum]
MSAQLQDVGLPLLTVAVLSPVAILCFRYGVPIEIIVFGLLCAGYKGPKWCRRTKAPGGDDQDVPVPSKAEVAEPSDSKTGGFPAWRPWKSKSKGEENIGTWRRDAKAKERPKPEVKEAKPKSSAALLKKNSSQTQWRSIINKFTPEKFDKLCEQLLGTLPAPGEDAEKPCDDAAFSKILEDLLSLIFDACSRQHQYTEMYTDLCQKLLDHVAQQRPNLDGRATVWERCQYIFQTIVLKPPEISADLPEDEYMDKKAKIKEKMVGMVKFGGDLVGRGLVPAEGVMTWIHTLLSEKTEEVFAHEGEDGALVKETDKDVEQREVQLEVLCAILASMGGSLSDPTVWNEENRLVIEDVFEQLEQLSVDDERLSLRIRCLIRDVLDLRMAQWKEKAGKLKPTALQRQKDEDERLETNLRSEAPEFVPGSKGGALWTSDRLLEGKPWMDAALLASLEVVEHHLEVIEDRDAKLQRLKSLIQLYHLIQEKQIVIVANTLNIRKMLDMISGSFGAINYRTLDINTPEQIRTQSLRSFEMGQVSMLLMTTDVSARRDFDFGKAAPVLINFDFPMTLQLYMYRIQKRADSSTHVYTFFSPNDVRHAASLIIVLEGARQKVPDALRKMKDQAKADGKKEQGRRSKEREDEEAGSKGSKRHDDRRWEGGRDSRRSEGPDGESGDRNRRAAGGSRLEERPDAAAGLRRSQTASSGGKDRWSEMDGGLQRSATVSGSTPSGPRQRREAPLGGGGDGQPRSRGQNCTEPEQPVRILSRGDRAAPAMSQAYKSPPGEGRSGPRNRGHGHR